MDLESHAKKVSQLLPPGAKLIKKPMVKQAGPPSTNLLKSHLKAEPKGVSGAAPTLPKTPTAKLAISQIPMATNSPISNPPHLKLIHTQPESSMENSVNSAIKASSDNPKEQIPTLQAKDEAPRHLGTTLVDRKVVIDPENLGMQSNALRNMQTLTQSLKDSVIVKRSTLTSAEKTELSRKARELTSATVQRFRYTEPHIRLHQTLEVLNDMENLDTAADSAEFIRTRQRMRQLMLQAHIDGRLGDALIEAVASLELAQAFYSAKTGQVLSGDMVLELIIICRCCGMTNQQNIGMKYLNQLRFLLESTLKSVVQQRDVKDSSSASQLEGSGLPGPSLKCEDEIVCQLLRELGEISLLYNENQLADTYQDKFLLLSQELFGTESLRSADAHNTVSLHYFKTRRYARALVDAQKALEIRKNILGDFWRVPPNARVADSYSNVGLLLRLTGKPEQALGCFYTALDMRLRLNHNNRKAQSVQDVLLCVGIVHHQLANFREALEIYNEVVKSRKEALGVDHPDTKHIVELLRRLEEDVKMAEEAAFNFKVEDSPRGTRAGLFLDGLFGPGMISKQTRMNLIKTALRPDIDDYRHKPLWLDSMTSRIRALYGEEIRALSVPSTAILPFVFTEVVGPDILALSAAIDRIGIPDEEERPSLPVVNVPKVDNGVASLQADSIAPVFALNPKAEDLFREWGVPIVKVEPKTGEVLEPTPISIPGDLPLILPIWDERFGGPMLGHEKKPLMVPNPAIAHLLVEGKPVLTPKAEIKALMKAKEVAKPKELIKPMNKAQAGPLKKLAPIMTPRELIEPPELNRQQTGGIETTLRPSVKAKPKVLTKPVELPKPSTVKLHTDTIEEVGTKPSLMKPKPVVAPPKAPLAELHSEKATSQQAEPQKAKSEAEAPQSKLQQAKIQSPKSLLPSGPGFKPIKLELKPAPPKPSLASPKLSAKGLDKPAQVDLPPTQTKSKGVLAETSGKLPFVKAEGKIPKNKSDKMAAAKDAAIISKIKLPPGVKSIAAKGKEASASAGKLNTSKGGKPIPPKPGYLESTKEIEERKATAAKKSPRSLTATAKGFPSKSNTTPPSPKKLTTMPKEGEMQKPFAIKSKSEMLRGPNQMKNKAKLPQKVLTPELKAFLPDFKAICRSQSFGSMNATFNPLVASDANEGDIFAIHTNKKKSANSFMEYCPGTELSLGSIETETEFDDNNSDFGGKYKELQRAFPGHDCNDFTLTLGGNKVTRIVNMNDYDFCMLDDETDLESLYQDDKDIEELQFGVEFAELELHGAPAPDVAPFSNAAAWNQNENEWDAYEPLKALPTSQTHASNRKSGIRVDEESYETLLRPAYSSPISRPRRQERVACIYTESNKAQIDRSDLLLPMKYVLDKTLNECLELSNPIFTSETLHTAPRPNLPAELQKTPFKASAQMDENVVKSKAALTQPGLGAQRVPKKVYAKPKDFAAPLAAPVTKGPAILAKPIISQKPPATQKPSTQRRETSSASSSNSSSSSDTSVSPRRELKTTPLNSKSPTIKIKKILKPASFISQVHIDPSKAAVSPNRPVALPLQVKRPLLPLISSSSSDSADSAKQTQKSVSKATVQKPEVVEQKTLSIATDLQYTLRPIPVIESPKSKLTPVYHRGKPDPAVSVEVLKKAKGLKPTTELVDTRAGISAMMPAVTLVDENGKDLVTLPWRLEIDSLLVRSAAVADTVARKTQQFPELKFLGKGPPDVFDALRVGAGLAELANVNKAIGTPCRSMLPLSKIVPAATVGPGVVGGYPQYAGIYPVAAVNTPESMVSGQMGVMGPIGAMRGMDQMHGMGFETLQGGLLGGLNASMPGIQGKPQPKAPSIAEKKATGKEGGEKAPGAKDSGEVEATAADTGKAGGGKKAPPAKGKGGKGGPPPGPKGKGPSKAVKGPGGKGPQPSSKTKKLFWDVVSDVSNTIWASKENLGINIGDIESVFAKAAPKAEEEVKREAKPKVLQILPDSKRSYNMNIALARFSSYTFQQLRDAVLDLTPDILNADATDTLILFSPTLEENTVVEEYIKSGADLKLLDRPEQFVAAMLGVPFLKQRLESHRYALSFMENFDSVIAPLDNILAAIEQLRSSTSLKAILTVALDIGNEMNKGAEAEGFKLSTLNKLNDIRTVTKPVRTLLQYIVDSRLNEVRSHLQDRVIYDQKIQYLRLIEEIPNVERAARLDLANVETNLAQLEAGLKKIQTVIEQAKKKNLDTGSMGDKDPLPEILSGFLMEAEPRLAELRDKMKAVKSKFVETAIFFGETEKTTQTLKPEVLFNDVWKFAKEIEATRKDKQEKEERERKRQLGKEKSAGGGKKVDAAPKTKATADVHKEVKKTIEAKPFLSTAELAPELQESRAFQQKGLFLSEGAATSSSISVT